MDMITITKNCITIKGEPEEVVDEMKELREVYGDKSISELIEIIPKRWKQK